MKTMDDHLIKEVTKCRKCGNDLEHKPWESQFEANQHYKTNTCDKCGKKNWIKVEFDGSGHDHWKPNSNKEM
ncbi:MAG: hypothetical protein ABIA37_01290 [Candidatus Woesearchaeota archaeon]